MAKNAAVKVANLVQNGHPASEAQLQALLWKIAWNEFPQSRRHIWAVPNGAKRSLSEQIVSKATGTLAGVWDLHAFYKGQFICFELKVKGNKLSKEQITWGELMVKSGAICVVITENDIDKFRSAMNIVFSEDKSTLATASLKPAGV